MTNFNPTNFNPNLNTNYQIKPTNQSPLKETQGGLQNNSQFGNNLNSLNLPNLTTLNFEAFNMDNKTALNYLKALLNIPNPIDEFIEDIKQNKPQLLDKNLINLSELQKLLSENSKEATQKLLNLMAFITKSTFKETPQLQEILAKLNQLSSTGDNFSNTLKELLLLYIPLNCPVEKQEDFSIKNEEQKEGNNTKSVGIMLETINFSNILCTMDELNNEIFIEIYLNEDFPFEKFKRIIDIFSKETNSTVIIDKKLSKSTNKNNNQNFKITSKDYISINGLILVNLIIKTVLKIDNGFI